MRRLSFTLLSLIMSGAAFAQTPPAAPAAGSSGGGGVGASVSSPTSPTGVTPPGAPSASTPAESLARDTSGQNVIGHTAAPGGNTGGAGTGAK